MKRNDRGVKNPKGIMWCLAIVLVVCVGTLVYGITNGQASDLTPAQTGNLAPTSPKEEAPSSSTESPDARHEGAEPQASSRTTTSSSKRNAGDASAAKILVPATRRGEVVIRHMAYTLSFNPEHNNPNWVAWELTADETLGNGRRSNEFLPDPDVEARHRVTTDDYKGSGYDRGHMCPAADNKWDAHAMTECFYMSNMCPQLHELNAGGWESLESACRRWAKREGSIHIVCGPIYDWEVKARQGQNAARKHKTIGKEHKVTVPTGFFKCILSLREGHEKAIAFLYANNDKKQSMEDVCVTVDSVESLTGFDFFVGLPKKLEKKVEAQFKLSDWK